MTSEIEIVCLSDSEDEDFSETQQVQSLDDWCPKIENVYSEARNDSPPTPDSSRSPPPSRSTDEVIDLPHLDNNLQVSNQDCEEEDDEVFSDEDIKKEMVEGLLDSLDEAKKSGKELLDLKTQYTQLYEAVTASLPDKTELCKSCLNEAFRQFYGITDFSEFLEESQIIESKVSSPSGSQKQQLVQGIQQHLAGCGGSASSQTGDIPFSLGFHSSASLHDEQILQNQNFQLSNCKAEIGSSYKISVSEDKDDEYKKGLLPLTACNNEMIHLEDNLEEFLDVKLDQPSLAKEEYILDKSFGDLEELKVDEPNQDTTDFDPDAVEDNIDESSPDKPPANCIIETGYTAMSDSDSMEDESSLKPFPRQSQSGKTERKRTNGRESVPDLRSVFARQHVEDGACSDSSDGMQHEDPDYICDESDDSDDDEEMRSPVKLSSKKTKKRRKVSSGIEDPNSEKGLIKKLEDNLKECKKDIKNLEEAETDFDDEKNSTYVLLGRKRKKYVALRKEIAKAKKVSFKLHLKPDKKFKFSGSRFPSINEKVEEFVKSNGFPNFNGIHKLIKGINSDENLFPKSELHAQAENIFKSVGEKLKARRIADVEQVRLSYLVHSDGSQVGDPANEDFQLEQKLQKNLELAKRNNVEALGDVEDSLVGEEPESEYSSEGSLVGEETETEYSSGDEESDSVDEVSDTEDEKYDYVGGKFEIGENEEGEELDSLETMSDEDEHQYDESRAPRKVLKITRDSENKSNSMDDTLETVTPIDELLGSSDEECGNV